MASAFFISIILLLLVLLHEAVLLEGSEDVAFGQSYNISWGADHVKSFYRGTEVLLLMDNTSGSGFQSKLEYASGFFHMDIKFPSKKTAGVVTAFYLSSHTNAHDELDFELLGDLEGKPIHLQTNVFVNGQGNREEKIRLWFFVDEIPIRVFMNKENMGVEYPTKPMQVMSSLWNGDDWATDGGKEKIDWRYAPFTASFRSFSIDGCPTAGPSNPQCYSSSYWWNGIEYTHLNPKQKFAYEQIRKNYLIYDYCTDRKRHPTRPPECPQIV